MMPENHPTPETKFAIVKEAWAGRKIVHVAKKYKVCRDSIYTWMQLATQACLHAFSPKKRGPKFKKLLKTEEVILSLEEKASNLESEIKRISHDSQTVPSLKYAKIVRPDHCPHCGHTQILLNGYYPVKGEEGAWVDMPRFICKRCRKRVYL